MTITSQHICRGQLSPWAIESHEMSSPKTPKGKVICGTIERPT